MYLFGLISGSILLALIFHDAFEVMLLPRRVRRKLRFITLLFRYTWNLWSWLAERMALGIRRDTFLSLYGPLSLVMLIGSWVIGLIVGFALIQCSLSFSAQPVSFGRQSPPQWQYFFHSRNRQSRVDVQAATI